MQPMAGPSAADPEDIWNAMAPSTLSQVAYPIKDLSLKCGSKWPIRALVMSKSPIRDWSNVNSKGKFFDIGLCDESGEIRATVWTNEVGFFDMIQVDKVYYISHCEMKTANKHYNYLKNDFEMHFSRHTIVTECMDDALPVPTIKYDFVSINEIGNKETGSFLDVIGVCHATSDVQNLLSSQGKPLKKREVTLLDSDGAVVVLTLWGNEAENFDGLTKPIVSLKGARVTEYNGRKSLSSNIMRLNPNLPEAHKLRVWYDNGGANIDVVNISASGSDEWITFSEAESKQLGAGDKADYYSLLGVPTVVFTDNAVYKACQLCNKKLADLGNGLFRCEKCDRDISNYNFKLLFVATVSDPTGDQRVTGFTDVAEAMTGKTAADIGHMVQHDKTGYVATIENIQYKTFVFKLQTKKETYNDEARLKTTAMIATPVDYKHANARLIKSIVAVTGVKV